MEFLYKYATADTCIKMLQKEKIRYSKPKIFNDPFDCNINLLNRANEADFLSEFSKQKINLIFQHYADSINKKLREVYQNSYILCLSENFDNLLMWSHYSQNHTGVVFTLKKVPEIDNLLIAEEKVVYSVKFPNLVDDDFLSKIQSSYDIGEVLYRKFMLTKAIDWSYEKEHRVIYPKFTDSGDALDHKLHKEELDSIYLGFKINTEQKILIIDLIKSKYPGTKIYKMNISNESYKLEPAQIY